MTSDGLNCLEKIARCSSDAMNRLPSVVRRPTNVRSFSITLHRAGAVKSCVVWDKIDTAVDCDHRVWSKVMAMLFGA